MRKLKSFRRISARTPKTTPRIQSILELLNLEIEQYKAWMGCPSTHSPLCYFKKNPEASMRDLYDQLVENQKVIRAL